MPVMEVALSNKVLSLRGQTRCLVRNCGLDTLFDILSLFVAASFFS